MKTNVLCGLLVLISTPGHSFREPVTIQSMEFEPPNSHEAGQTHKIQGTQFVNKGMGEIKSDDGTVFAFTTYQAPDGTSLMVLHKEYQSEVLAREQFDRELGKAEKVLERAVRKNREGKVVGERGSAAVRSPKSGNVLHAVLWTSGPHFNEIISSSLPRAVELEKVLNH